MRTTTKVLLAVLGLVAVGGVGLAAAQSTQASDTPASFRAAFRAFHRHPIAAIDKVCDDNVTWGDCKELLKEKADQARAELQQKAQERYDECLQSHSQDYCQGRLDQFKAEHPRVYGNQTQ